LLIARLVVGSAESAQSPATMSLIGDLAPPQKRGTAIMVTVLGSAIGFAAGSALAGALSDRYSWHVALMVVGGPGLLVAALLYLTVREPPRGAQEGAGQVIVARENIWECLRRCARIRTLYPFAAGWICMQISFAGWLTWVPAFLMRVHHLSATKMGAVFGSIIACSILGVALSGPLSDFVAKRGARWRLYYCSLAAVISTPILAASTLVPTLGESTVLLIAYTLFSGGITTVGTAVYVSIAPPTMRGFMTAVMGLAAALLGAGSAPVLYGAVNDMLKKTLGDESLRYTLLLSPLAMGLAAIFFLMASRTADQDVAAAGQTAEAA
jgi:MFS family permease